MRAGTRRDVKGSNSAHPVQNVLFADYLPYLVNRDGAQHEYRGYAGLVNERSRVRVPARAAGEFLFLSQILC